jgi:peptidoglycan-associated lipoprotein
MNRFLYLPLVALVACKGCIKEPKNIVEDGDGAVTAPPAAQAEKPSPAPVAQMAANFNRVFFEYDSTTLSAEGKASLEANAGIMQEFPDIKLEIQGHADERGTTEYNLALGQKRADSVVQYMLAKGVASSRVKSVSYGEERPLDGRSTERAWEMNRRAEFVITWSGDAPVKGTVN